MLFSDANYLSKTIFLVLIVPPYDNLQK